MNFTISSVNFTDKRVNPSNKSVKFTDKSVKFTDWSVKFTLKRVENKKKMWNVYVGLIRFRSSSILKYSSWCVLPVT